MLLSEAPQFLSLTELQAEIAAFSYQPGWTMEICQDPWEGPFLYVVANVIDGYHPEQTVELRIRSNVPPIPSREYFAIWLQWRMDQIALHESREYLRRGGRPVFDPHDPVEPGGRAAQPSS
jgi:hypothetical protein